MTTCGDAGGRNARGEPCGVRTREGRCRVHREGTAADTSAQLKKAAFLQVFREVGNVSAAARLADVPRRSHYEWLKSDLEYAAEYADAEAEAADVLEEEARRRAVCGVEEPVGWYRGVAGGTVQRYSDTLLIFLLKGARPEKYRDRVALTGGDGEPLTIRVVQE